MRTLLSLSALFLLAPLALGCSGAEGAHDPAVDPAGDPAVETTSALTPLVTPCDLGWRLPTADWPVLQPAASTYPAPFYIYEKELYKGGSLWFGKKSTADGAFHRALVHVDLVRIPDKKVESKLWFLALIPYAEPPDPASATMQAIYRYRATEPVDAIALGYCLDDNTFLDNRWDPWARSSPAPVVPPNRKIRYVVTMYDPRCTCTAATARTTAVVSADVWNSAM